MLAPSPDWFVAVSSIHLIEDNDWVDQKTADLSVFDAETDNGSTYTSANQITNPVENISAITTPPLAVDGVVHVLGTVHLERIK